MITVKKVVAIQKNRMSKYDLACGNIITYDQRIAEKSDISADGCYFLILMR